MNNTMMNTTIANEVNLSPLILMGGLLISVPLLCCLCCLMSIIHKYVYEYGEYTDNSIDDTEKQLKCRGCYESLFGSILSPKLTKIIVVTVAFENQSPNP